MAGSALSGINRGQGGQSEFDYDITAMQWFNNNNFGNRGYGN